ncbi:hypothetical protein WMC41_23745 (plasmid) [Shinella yambaruensis]
MRRDIGRGPVLRPSSELGWFFVGVAAAVALVAAALWLSVSVRPLGFS